MNEPDASKAFDVVVWGATGFTGTLVTRHLAKHAPSNLRIAIAGRSEEKLCSLVGSLVERGDSDVLLPMLQGDAGDLTDMSALAKVARCVVSAAGPYGERISRATRIPPCNRASTRRPALLVSRSAQPWTARIAGGTPRWFRTCGRIASSDSRR